MKAVIRHGEAGRRDRWEGDDRLRPLSKKGWRQAEALLEALAGVRYRRILSSPYIRCVQSVQPLAEAQGVPVEETEELAEGAGLQPTLALIQRLAGTSAALCTHGDIMVELCDHLVERGLIGRDQVRYAKGAAWVLEEEKGDLVAAHYLPAQEARRV